MPAGRGFEARRMEVYGSIVTGAPAGFCGAVAGVLIAVLALCQATLWASDKNRARGLRDVKGWRQWSQVTVVVIEIAP
jgi:hypothetical protein